MFHLFLSLYTHYVKHKDIYAQGFVANLIETVEHHRRFILSPCQSDIIVKRNTTPTFYADYYKSILHKYSATEDEASGKAYKTAKTLIPSSKFSNILFTETS